MGRKTLTVPESVWRRLKDEKRDDESFGDLLDRLVDVVQEGGEQDTDAVDLPDNILTEDHIDDIAAITAAKAGEELEDRMRGR